MPTSFDKCVWIYVKGMSGRCTCVHGLTMQIVLCWQATATLILPSGVNHDHFPGFLLFTRANEKLFAIESSCALVTCMVRFSLDLFIRLTCCCNSRFSFWSVPTFCAFASKTDSNMVLRDCSWLTSARNVKTSVWLVVEDKSYSVLAASPDKFVEELGNDDLLRLRLNVFVSLSMSRRTLLQAVVLRNSFTWTHCPAEIETPISSKMHTTMSIL